MERTITSLNDLDDAVKSLTNDGIDIFFISGDVMISQVIPQLAQTMQKKGIPFFTNTAEDVNSGAFLSMGADYFEVGEKAAAIFEAVLAGTNPNDIPIEKYVPFSLGVNLTLAKGFGVMLPDTLVKNAKIVIH